MCVGNFKVPLHLTANKCVREKILRLFSTSLQAQMVRRVKAYLKNMKVITDEDKLHAMSLECEPPIGGSSAGLSAASAIQIPPPSVRTLRNLFTTFFDDHSFLFAATKT